MRSLLAASERSASCTIPASVDKRRACGVSCRADSRVRRRREAGEYGFYGLIDQGDTVREITFTALWRLLLPILSEHQRDRAGNHGSWVTKIVDLR